MPGWSTEVANEFIRMAATDRKAFTQMHLQELVYIAHGWCLAITGQPLTGDRPEALEHGPEYRRLANALARSGDRPVKSEIQSDCVFDEDERAIMARVYASYSHRRTSELAVLTRAGGTPWARIFAGGSGKGRDIGHQTIRDQFAEIAAKFA